MAKASPKDPSKHTDGPSESRVSQAAKQAAPTGMQLDKLIHDRVRLGILSALAVDDGLSFNELKKLLKVTDGNLSVHARKLEDAGYIECHKRFEGRTPRTEYGLTQAGKSALERYLAHMEAIISHVKQG